MVHREENKAGLGSEVAMSAQDENSGTTSVRLGFELNAGLLDRWLRSHVDDYGGPLTIEQFKGGQSNPTYKLVTPRRNYVLRKQPVGDLLKGAHAVDREAKVIQALGEAGFPVPRIYGLCTDTSVIGTIFYVMELVEGQIFWDATAPSVSRVERHAIFASMNATIAQLHSIDYHRIGLQDFGKAGNYFERQIARWTRQYLEDDTAGRDLNMDRLIEWLPENIPDGDETSLVHGDFRIDNMIFHPVEPRIIAVLDWELSTLGHPGADFAYHAMMYRMPPHIVAGLRGANITSLGIPTESEYLTSYCLNRGIDALPGYDFYMAFNLFRLAAIFHGIKGRCVRGTAASAQARERAQSFPELAQLAWYQASKLSS